MHKTITLLGEPKSTGSIYKTRSRPFPGIYMSKAGKTMKKSYIEQTTRQWANKPLTGDISIHVRLYFGTKRKSDIDNFHKLSFDSFTKIVWVDDSQIQKMFVEKFYDKKNPRIEITILEAFKVLH